MLTAGGALALGASVVPLFSPDQAAAATTVPAPLNVYDFGAVGDGTHDDTAAFQAAVAALPAGGGSVYAPRGTFLLHSVNIAGFNVTLVGDGESTILAKASSSPPLAVAGSGMTLSSMRIFDKGHGGSAVQATAANGGNRLRIHDLTYQASSPSAQGLAIKDYSDVHVEGCVLEGLSVSSTSDSMSHSGIALTSSGTLGSPGAARVLLRGNIIRGFAIGIGSGSGAETSRLMIEGNHIESATLYGVYLLHTPRARVVGNNIRDCNWGIWYDVGKDDGTGTSVAAEGPVFLGNQVSFCTVTGIGIGIARCATVTGNTAIACGDGIVLGDASTFVTVSGNTSHGNSGNGIVLDRFLVAAHQYGVYDNTIAANTVAFNGKHGILVRGSQGTLLIAGNTINSNGAAAAHTYSGVRIEHDQAGTGNSMVTITGNVVANTTDGSALRNGQQADGVSVESGSLRRLVLTHNYFRGNTAYSVNAPSPLGTGQTITVSGNHADDVGYALPASGLELGLNFGLIDGLPVPHSVDSQPHVTGYVPVQMDGVTYKLATIT